VKNKWPFVYEAHNANTDSQFWEKAIKLGGETLLPKTFPRVIMCKEISPGKYERRAFDSVGWFRYVMSAAEKEEQIKTEILKTLTTKIKNIEKDKVSDITQALKSVAEGKSFSYLG